MKVLYFLLVVLLFSLPTKGQKAEFITYTNGLIYSQQTMDKLKHIVDSLNLQYNHSDPNKVFYSKNQALGHFIQLTKGNLRQAKKDIRKRISFEAFLKKYPDAKVERKVLIVRYVYHHRDGYKRVIFSKINPLRNRDFKIEKFNKRYHKKKLQNTWVYEYYSKARYTFPSLSAFFFTENFSSKPIPKKYVKMINYVDCLTDTTTLKFKENISEGNEVDLPPNWSKLSYKKQRKLLDQLRSFQAVSSCSQDNSPREQTKNIALLAASTSQWKVFLRAHLDITNDYFNRMSDGGYAQAGRQTYIKELDMLHINTPYLLLGISLQAENMAQKHYYGNISRIGRALTETKYTKEIRQMMCAMIEDNQLDDFNRVLVYFLFLNYNYYTKNAAEKSENKLLLEKSIQKLPEYIRTNIADSSKK